MKLTLRTLLAFLDETVSQDDAAALRKKIKESKAIRELIERIRRVVSQPQLPAPHQSGKGLDANPNYPCEYIDSTLDPEKVAEFEKRAISSDALLAEIAEAHQILAQLSEIDEGVSGRLRNRLYKTTESIYRTNSEEPEMFPVIEDHASIQEEYEDAPEPPRSKPGFDLSPPSQPASHSDSRSQFSDIPPVQPPPVVSNPSPDRQFSIDARSDQTGQAAKTPPRFPEGFGGCPFWQVGNGSHCRIHPLHLQRSLESKHAAGHPGDSLCDDPACPDRRFLHQPGQLANCCPRHRSPKRKAARGIGDQPGSPADGGSRGSRSRKSHHTADGRRPARSHGTGN